METFNLDMKRKTQETISALVDGELDPDEMTDLLNHADIVTVQATWARYHYIGDVMRSSALARPFSEDFERQLQARLVGSSIPVAAPVPQRRTQRLSTMLQVLRTLHGRGRPHKLMQWAGLAALTWVSFLVIGASSLSLSHDAIGLGYVQLQAQLGMKNDQIDSRLAMYLAAHQRVAPGFYSAGEGELTVPVVALSN
jgi:hypothetical protein